MILFLTTNVKFVMKTMETNFDDMKLKYEARKGTRVNYPPTAKLMGWASEVIDSPNGNALLRFCLIVKPFF